MLQNQALNPEESGSHDSDNYFLSLFDGFKKLKGATPFLRTLLPTRDLSQFTSRHTINRGSGQVRTGHSTTCTGLGRTELFDEIMSISAQL
jgi:hypothetical protein